MRSLRYLVVFFIYLVFFCIYVPVSHAQTATQKIKLYPIADTYVRADQPNTAYGTEQTLKTNASPEQIIYLTFDLAQLQGKVLKEAVFGFTVTSASSYSRFVRHVADTSWTESMTYTTRPQLGAPLGGFNTQKDYSGLFSTALADPFQQAIAKAAGTKLSIAITSKQYAWAMNSRESTNKPYLEIEYYPAIGGTSATNFTPAQQPLSTTIVNPMRGLYKWEGAEMAPQPNNSPDAYERFFWKDIEPQDQQFDFSAIDSAIEVAVAEGRKFSFRLRSMRGYNDPVVYVPDFMKPYGWYADTNQDGSKEQFVPDWNSPEYLKQTRELLTALGNRYNGDPRVAWIDVGMYGQYGEWALDMNKMRYAESGGKTAITDASKQHIIDSHIQAFPNHQLVMFYLHSNLNAILYARQQTKNAIFPAGLRSDCIGKKDFWKQWTDRPTDWAQVNEIWKTAPVVSETCGALTPGSTTQNFTIGLEHAKLVHLANMGNGNVDAFSAYDNTEQAAFLEIGRLTGYRIGLRGATVSSFVPGQSITVTSTWSNTGLTPVYEKWRTTFSLQRSDTQTVVWEGISTVNLNTLMPTYDYATGIDTPVQHNDAFLLPASVPAGNYLLTVKITDSNPYDSAKFPEYRRPPLRLINTDRLIDGTYIIGTVTVTDEGAGSVTTAPTATTPPQKPTVKDIISSWSLSGNCITNTSLKCDLNNDGKITMFDLELL